MIAPKTWPARFDMIRNMNTGETLRIPHGECVNSKCFEANKLSRSAVYYKWKVRVLHVPHREELWVVKL